MQLSSKFNEVDLEQENKKIQQENKKIRPLGIWGKKGCEGHYWSITNSKANLPPGFFLATSMEFISKDVSMNKWIKLCLDVKI